MFDNGVRTPRRLAVASISLPPSVSQWTFALNGKNDWKRIAPSASHRPSAGTQVASIFSTRMRPSGTFLALNVSPRCWSPVALSVSIETSAVTDGQFLPQTRCSASMNGIRPAPRTCPTAPCRKRSLMSPWAGRAPSWDAR